MVKKTEWYPANVKPVRNGRYEVQGCQVEVICGGSHYWNGNEWLMTPHDRWAILNYPWRGVKK